MRTIKELLNSGLDVVDRAFDEACAARIVPLLSGGHDSTSACFIASMHPRFTGEVYHINTTIGLKACREHVDRLCLQLGWRVHVFTSNYSYEKFVRTYGFPGPGGHQWVYNRLKDRCITALARGWKTALITGCRTEESERRMGHAEPIQIGEKGFKKEKYWDKESECFIKTGNLIPVVRNKNRIWTTPCHDWTVEEQTAFMDYYDLPLNPVKQSPLGMSGECLCGAFARPGEIDLIRAYFPDGAKEIDRLTPLAAHTKHKVWGVRGEKEKGLVLARTGMLCSRCDLQAAASGLLFENLETSTMTEGNDPE